MDQKASGTEWSERPSTTFDNAFAFLEKFECPWIKACDIGQNNPSKKANC